MIAKEELRSDPDKLSIEKPSHIKRNYKVIGGILGDKDRRTKRGLRILLVTSLALLFIVTGLIGTIFKYYDYNQYLINNTTPIGSSLTFARSGADITVSDVWTDQNRDLTVVKLLYSANARKLLSTQGKNYNLYMATKKQDQPQKLQMSYGMLSTDGEAFLFLKGKLDKRAYQIFIANQVKLISGDTSNNNNNEANLVNENDTVTKALAQYSMDDVDQKGEISFGKKQKPVNTPDNLNFRINPYSESTNVYQGSFLTKDGDIDYSKVVSVASKKNVVSKLETKVNEQESDIKRIKATKSEYLDRLQQNPDDQDSQESIRQLDTQMKTEATTLARTKKMLSMYQSATFDKNSFGEMQTKFNYLTLK